MTVSGVGLPGNSTTVLVMNAKSKATRNRLEAQLRAMESALALRGMP